MEAFLELDDKGATRTVSVDSDRFTLGRRSECDLTFPNKIISRMHAAIVLAGDEYVIQDPGSTCGTYVNGERVSEATLKDGDIIRLGPTGIAELRFRLDEEDDKDPITQIPRTGEPANDLQQVALLLEGLRAMGSGRVLDEVLAVVIDSAIDLVGAERGFIMMPDADDELSMRLARGRGGTTLDRDGIITSRRIPQHVYRTGEVQLARDLEKGEFKDAHTTTVMSGIRGAICVPLRLLRQHDATVGEAGERGVIGVLYLDSRAPAQLMSSIGRTALEALADEAAVAIEQARLYRENVVKEQMEQDLQRATDMQLSLLPARIVESGPFDIAGDAIPCHAVGGDFFDYFINDEGVVCALADVSGKGIPAALFAAQTQGVLASWADSCECPSEVVTRINYTLSRRRLSATFVTMACATISAGGMLTSCNAGHNPPLILRADGGIEPLSAGGLILGPFSDADYDKESTQLAAGDALIIYSDGITECMHNSGERFGEERLYDCLRHCAGRPAAHILETVLDAVAAFSRRGPHEDDQTVLIVRYTGEHAGESGEPRTGTVA